MANQPIPTLPAAIGLSGDEQIEIVQPGGTNGTSKRTSVSQIGTYISSTYPVPAITSISTSSPLQVNGGLGPVSSGAVTLQIAAQGITNSLLAPMGAYTVKANVTGSSAVPTDATVSAVLDTISAVQGSVLYRGNTTWQALPPGTNGYVLATSGAGANPSWVLQTQYNPANVTITGGTINGTTIGNTVPAAGTFTTLSATTSLTLTNPLTVPNGGTGAVSFTNKGVLYGNGTAAIAATAAGTTGQALLGNTGSAPSWGQVDLTTTVTGVLPAPNGGTGFPSYTTGDLLYADSSNTLARLNDVVTGNALISGGVGVAPSWGKIGLTTHVSGVLPTANGGTNLSSFTSGGAMYATSASVLTTGTLPITAGGTGITSFGTGVQTALGQNVTGSGGIVLATSPTLVTPNLGTPSAVTLTNATGLPLTTGVTGILPIANGGTGISSFGTGVQTALGQAVTGSGGIVLATSPTLTTPNLGTPSAVTLTNATGLPLTTGVTGTLPVANGGTGATTLSGWLFGNGTSAFTAVATIPNSGLTNSSVTIGSTNIALGGTSTTLAGLTTVTLTQDPTLALQASTKQYVDNTVATVANLTYHTAAAYATTVDLGSVTYSNGVGGVGATLTNAGTQAALAMDGYTFTATDVTNATRVLVKNESNAAYNGVYTVTNQGSVSTNWVLTRATDFNTTGSGPNFIETGAAVFVSSGTLNGSTSWVLTTTGTITIGTTALTFTQNSASGSFTVSAPLAKAGNNISLNTVTVPFGGTGLTTLTQYAVMLGAGTGNVAFASPGTTGYPLLSNGAAANPSFGQLSLTAGVTGTLPIANGGTGITSFGTGVQTALGQAVTGSGGIVLATSPTLVTPALGTPSAVVLTNATGLPLSTGVTGTLGTSNGGTGLTTFTAANNAIYSTSASVLTAGTLPIAAGGTGITSFGTGVQTALGQAVTGSGGIVLATSPTLVTPALGTPSAVVLTNATGLPLSSGVTGTLPVGNGGTGTATAFTSGSVVFAGASGVYSQNNSKFFWDNTNIRLGLNTASPNTTLNIVSNTQTATPPSAASLPAGTDLYILGANAANTRITQDAYGTGNYAAYTGRSARNTAASPTASQTDDILVEVTGRGYGTTGFSTQSVVRIDMEAAEAFTDTAQGTYMSFHTTATGTTSPTERFRIGPSGQLGIGGATYGTSGYVLTSAGASAAPTWSQVSLTSSVTGTLPVGNGGTGATTFTANGILYGNTTSALGVTAAGTTNQVLLGNTGAAPSWGAVNLGTAAVTGTLGLSNGGTNASLTASNGGIIYSTASAMAVLSGTATANQVLLSGSSSAPSWSTATYPATTTVNQLLYSGTANVVSGLATANSSILVTSGAGVPSWSTTLPAHTVTTSVTVPLVIGGSGTTGTQLTLQTTTGIGTTDAFAFKGGNNGATTFATLAAAGLAVTSTGANALAVGPSGTTTPSLNVDASTASAVTGLNIKSAAAGAGLALSVISSVAQTNENLTIDAKGSGTIGIGTVSTGVVTITSGGVAPQGTGAYVRATSPTLTTPTLGVATATSINKVTITAPATSAALTIADGKTVTHNATTTFAGVDSKTLTINNSLTLAGTDGTTMTFPTSTDTVAGIAATQTLTNKRINPRISTTASSASAITIDISTYDEYILTAQAAALTFNASTTGSPLDGNKIIIKVKDNGTSQTLTFTGSGTGAFRPVGVSLTTSGSNYTYATTVSKVVYFGCIYNAAESLWDIVALAQQ